MHYAALHGYTDAIDILAKAGATVDLKEFTEGDFHLFHLSLFNTFPLFIYITHCMNHL